MADDATNLKPRLQYYVIMVTRARARCVWLAITLTLPPCCAIQSNPSKSLSPRGAPAPSFRITTSVFFPGKNKLEMPFVIDTFGFFCPPFDVTVPGSMSREWGTPVDPANLCD